MQEASATPLQFKHARPALEEVKLRQFWSGLRKRHSGRHPGGSAANDGDPPPLPPHHLERQQRVNQIEGANVLRVNRYALLKTAQDEHSLRSRDEGCVDDLLRCHGLGQSAKPRVRRNAPTFSLPFICIFMCRS